MRNKDYKYIFKIHDFSKQKRYVISMPKEVKDVLQEQSASFNLLSGSIENLIHKLHRAFLLKKAEDGFERTTEGDRYGTTLQITEDIAGKA